MVYDWVQSGREGGNGVTVYLDEVFLVNAVVNGLLLETSVRLTGGARSPGRLLGAAALGGIYAVAVWLPELGWLASIPGQFAAWAGLCVLCFGWRGTAWKSWLWFFGVCCGFAGLVLAAASLLRVPAISGGGRVWYRVSGRLLIGCAVGLWGLCSLCLDRFARHRGQELVTLRLELGGRAVVCTALRDNGNTLRDPFTGRGVPVVERRVLARLVPELEPAGAADAAALMDRLHSLRPELRIALLPYRAVGTEGGLLLGLYADRILENGKPVLARLVARSPTPVSDGGTYEALIPVNSN